MSTAAAPRPDPIRPGRAPSPEASSALDLEHRRARARAYAILSKLVLRGGDEAVLAEAADLPGLRETFGDALDPEALAADHYDLFGLQAPPYAATFLGDHPESGAALLEELSRALMALGFSAIHPEVTADHLGVLLGALSFGDHAHAAALHDGHLDLARRIEAQLAELLDRFVLSWLPCWTAAALRLDNRWSDLAALLHAFVHSHRATLDAPRLRTDRPPLPPLDPTDPALDLRALARHLTTPSRCGLYLTRTDLLRLARRHHLPCGFGPRRLLLENLLHAAQTHQALPAVGDDLAKLHNSSDSRKSCV